MKTVIFRCNKYIEILTAEVLHKLLCESDFFDFFSVVSNIYIYAHSTVITALF